MPNKKQNAKLQLCISYSNLRKSKVKTSWKKSEEKKILFAYEEAKKKKSDFSSETIQRREWSGIFKVLTEEKHQSRMLYPERLSFKSKQEIKTFSDKRKNEEVCCQ